MSPDGVHWNSLSEANKERLLCTKRESFLLYLNALKFSVFGSYVYLCVLSMFRSIPQLLLQSSNKM